ncbi:hypothetical protein ACH55_23290, partial [Salmonella enterica subsp. enterica serovar Typhimurium]
AIGPLDVCDELAIQLELVVGQREPCEQTVLLGQKIGEDRFAVDLASRDLERFVHALQAERQLCCECIARTVSIEAFEEGVERGLLEHHVGAGGFGQPAGERRLAHADRAFDGQITETPQDGRPHET